MPSVFFRPAVAAATALVSGLFATLAHATPASEIAVLAPAPLHGMYEARQFNPLWLENGKPSARANEAITLMASADSEGLLPADYDLSTLRQQLAALAEKSGDDHQQAAFDLAMSQALLHYFSDLSLGRVEPADLGLDIDTSAHRTALQPRILAALAATDLPAAGDALHPSLPYYAALRHLLVTYRALATLHPETPALPALPGKKLEPGKPWDGIAALTGWLAALGDLPTDTAPPAIYEGALVDGVKHFQSRHGLEPDGVIGKGTYDALQVPLSQRIQQIELAMERLRWLDDSSLLQQRFIAINIPQFTLWAMQPGAAGPTVVEKMPVVVGKAGKHETPVMTKTLSSLVFSPYWNVPRSIAVKEILPQLREDPQYLVHEDMELVGAGGAHGGIVTADDINGIVLGDYRIRQRPGAKNALGTLKFVFPNDDSIYMHDTPSKKLFAKARRDFSHGCIRVGNPMALALFALQAQGEWSEEKVKAKIASSRDQHLALKERMPVLLLYLTANTDGQGNAVFLQDIYGQDAKLAAALGRRK